MNFFLNKWRFALGMVILSSLLFVACKKDDPEPPPPVNETDYGSGIFILNEGPFQNGTGTITYLSRNGFERVDNLFQTANNLTPLGNIVQSWYKSIPTFDNSFLRI
jgi:hypothetical protein